jgi:hydrogenase nickel incorporation protein HypA/HybF
MHEYSIVQDLLDRVGAEAVARGAVTVRRLQVSIGELAGVDPQLLVTAFSLFREHPLCRDTELDIRPVAARWDCPRCRRAIARGAVLRCAHCGTPAELAAGGEILLERIEMEVP